MYFVARRVLVRRLVARAVARGAVLRHLEEVRREADPEGVDDVRGVARRRQHRRHGARRKERDPGEREAEKMKRCTPFSFIQ